MFRMRFIPLKSLNDFVDKSTADSSKLVADVPTAGSSPLVVIGCPPKVIVAMSIYFLTKINDSSIDGDLFIDFCNGGIFNIFRINENIKGGDGDIILSESLLN